MIDLRCCDNLKLMAEIPSNTIDLIYCDILYGTGRNFGDYQDLKPIRSEIESHYLPRLIEMKRVLKQNGSIYLQMDTRINHWMRILMDDVFGYDNFRNEIVWCYETAGRKSNKKYRPSHDVILFYSMPNNILIDCEFLEKIENNYSGYYQDNKGWYQMTGTGDYSDESIQKLKLKGLIHTNNKGKNYLKIYLISKEDGLYKAKQLKDVWSDIQTFGGVNKHLKKQFTGYATQKPKELISRIVLASTNEGDVVADYYLGSGTTAEVCKDLNRNFIGCDINPRAVEIAKNRIENTKKPNVQTELAF
jgi:site-specific DNA-methyltransferase (adenine-specific)